MTPQDLATEAELRRVMDAAFRRASERIKFSRWHAGNRAGATSECVADAG